MTPTGPRDYDPAALLRDAIGAVRRLLRDRVRPGSSLDTSTIKTRTGMGMGLVRRALEAMVADGELVRIEHEDAAALRFRHVESVATTCLGHGPGEPCSNAPEEGSLFCPEFRARLHKAMEAPEAKGSHRRALEQHWQEREAA